MPVRFTFIDYFCVRRKFLLYNLILRNLKMRYRKSLLGMLWTVLIPAGTACIYYVVFQMIFKVKIPNYLLFILSGIIPWTFFATSMTVGVESLVINYGLLNKVPLPPQALPLSDVLTHFLNLALSLPVIAAAMLILGTVPTLACVQYPVLLIVLLLLTYAANLSLAVMYVYFRDLKHIVSLILQFWFYLTPVMYSTSMIPEKYRFALIINPLGMIFSGFHASLIENRWLSWSEWLPMIVWTTVLIFISKTLMARLRNSIIEML